jgi:hypothetical protein
MKMVKSLLLGTAAGLVALSGAQAADLPVKAKPVQYVKICSLYGAGFYYIPGTDTCIKVGGFMRAEVNFNAQGSYAVQTGAIGNANNQYVDFWRTRFGVSFDTRTQTEYGTLRSYALIASTDSNSQSTQVVKGQTGPGFGNSPGSANDPYTALWSNAAFIQFAGFTAGKLGSFFDYDLQPYSNQTNFWGSNLAGGGIDLFAYTAQLGNGLSASIAAENAQGHRLQVWDGTGTALGGVSTTTTVPALPATTVAGWQYSNQQVPDIIGNLRVDQAWGGAQVMGAYHELNLIQGTTATAASINSSGYALGAGVKVNLPMIGVGDNVIAQFTYAQGATLYIGSGINVATALTNSGGTTRALAYGEDAVVDAAGGLHKTSGWSVTGGFEHHWNPAWKTSLFGAYGQLNYDATASAVLVTATGAGSAGSANWNYTQIGSRTVWTPVANLDLSVEVMYNSLNTGFGGSGTAATGFGNLNWVSGIFRAQRNFYP